MQISPLLVNGFKNGFHQWIQRIFLVVVEAKKFFPKKIFWFSKFGCNLPPCSEEEEEEILFCQTKRNKKTTQIALNHGRLPEKGLRPSKLATYCITQQNTKKYKCATVQKCAEK